MTRTLQSSQRTRIFTTPALPALEKSLPSREDRDRRRGEGGEAGMKEMGTNHAAAACLPFSSVAAAQQQKRLLLPSFLPLTFSPAPPFSPKRKCYHFFTQVFLCRPSLLLLLFPFSFRRHGYKLPSSSSKCRRFSFPKCHAHARRLHKIFIWVVVQPQRKKGKVSFIVIVIKV